LLLFSVDQLINLGPVYPPSRSWSATDIQRIHQAPLQLTSNPSEDLMSGQLSHANSQLVTRDQLLTIAPPPSTATWRPIAHADLITAIDRQLLVRGIAIKSETFAIQREGARLFAVLDLSIERSGEFCASLGIRTANDRSLALEIAVGVKVF